MHYHSCVDQAVNPSSSSHSSFLPLPSLLQRHLFVLALLLFVTCLLSDGILNHENEELRDRVAVLERKVHQQEDEVICLKSALSDCLRRLQALENGRGV